MKHIEVGAQLYTIREFTKTPEDIEESLCKIKEMGYDVIQISGFGPIETQKLADIINKLKLKVCITHMPYVRLTDDLDNIIAEHKLLGCDVVGVGSMPQQFRGSLEGAREFIKSANEIAKKLKKNGMKLAYHNHNFEFEKFNNKTIMDTLIEELNQEIEFIIDTYWIQAGGANSVDYIKKVAGRMSVCHFKDMAIVDGKQSFAEIGNGNMDFKEIYKACEDTKVKYIVIEQDKCNGNPFDSLKISLDYMNKNF